MDISVQSIRIFAKAPTTNNAPAPLEDMYQDSKVKGANTNQLNFKERYAIAFLSPPIISTRSDAELNKVLNISKQQYIVLIKLKR